MNEKKKKKNMNKVLKNMVCVVFYFSIFFSVWTNSFVYADTTNPTHATENGNIPGVNTPESGGSSAGDMWQQATLWFKGVNKDDNSSQAVDIINEFVDMVNVIGTTVIVIATIILGIKYIFGSVDSKADVKESLITLFVACIFFFGWTAIKNVLFPSNQFALTSDSDSSYKDLIGRVFNIVVYFANIAAILGVIYVGVRYIFSGANGRAELKGKAVYFLIGIILSFATVSFLTFLSSSINEII